MKERATVTTSPVSQETQAASPEIGVILGQVGTPQSLDRPEVRRYLKEFLSDERIIDLPKWRWQPVLRLAVLPTRPKMVGHHFAEIWTDEGSPLLVLSEAQRDGIQERLGPRYRVELGMAYSEPSMARAVANLEATGIRKIVVLPLFPQYSNSTTASIYDEVMFHALGRGTRKGLPKKKYSPTLRFIHPFYDDPDYIAVLADSVRRQLDDGPEPDRIILSYHGLPRRFDDEGDPYRIQCEETTRLLAEALGWPGERYEMAYQSRFGRTEWIKPYLQPRLEELHGSGVAQPVIISPGFTTDCLETLHELGVEGRELFGQGGGDPARYRTIACLNTEPAWLDYAAKLIEKNALGW
jgi:ferrochelatase